MRTTDKRPCRYCRRWFRPDRRVGKRQYACSGKDCQTARQADNEAARIDRDPGYWRGRAEKHRAYRREHPEINRIWRQHHREKREQDRIARKKRREKKKLQCAAEHKARALQLIPIVEVKGRVSSAAEHKQRLAEVFVIIGLVAWVTCAAEHKENETTLVKLHDHGRYLLGGGHGKAKTG